MALVLFNLYFAAMVACWRCHCPEAGVTVRYKMGRKLVGDRIAKTRLEATVISLLMMQPCMQSLGQRWNR